MDENILTEALVNSATNASFIFSYTNSAKLRLEISNSLLKSAKSPLKNINGNVYNYDKVKA